MKNWLLLPFLVLLTACATSYPLGMSEEQWKTLTPSEREQLLLQEQKYQAEQRLARIKADALEKQRQHEIQMAEQTRLQALYDQPANGNVMMVNILSGQHIKGKNVKNIKPETYQIARGETKRIALLLQDNKNRITTTHAFLSYEINGNGIYLHLDNPAYNQRTRIALLRDGNWSCGSRYSKNFNNNYQQLKRVQFFIKEVGAKCRPDQVIKAPRKIYR